MAELVDALASGASALMGVEVRVLFWAPQTANCRAANSTGPVHGTGLANASLTIFREAGGQVLLAEE